MLSAMARKSAVETGLFYPSNHGAPESGEGRLTASQTIGGREMPVQIRPSRRPEHVPPPDLGEGR